MQQIESLKFEHDVNTGLTYFDSMNEIIKLGNKEVEGLKKIYKKNLQMLNQLDKKQQEKVEEEFTEQV